MKHSEDNLSIALFTGAKVIGEYLGSEGGYTDSKFLDFFTEGKKEDLIYPGNSRYWSHNVLKYHLSWEWLMPVVDKIESMGYEVLITKPVGGHYICQIKSLTKGINIRVSKPSRIEAVYVACKRFLNEVL